MLTRNRYVGDEITNKNCIHHRRGLVEIEIDWGQACQIA